MNIRKPPLYAFLAVLLALGLYRAAESQIHNWSTTAGSNNAAPPLGAPENMARSAVNDVIRENMKEVRRFAQQDVMSTFAPDGGVADAYFITPAIAPGAATLVSGAVFRFIPANDSTITNPTIKIGTFGPVTIARISTATLAAGDLQKGIPAEVLYNATQGGVILRNPQRPISFRAHKNGTAQNVSSAAATKMTLGTESFDYGGYFANSTWTPPPGLYQITAAANFQTTGLVDQSNVAVAIYKNGVLAAQVSNQVSGNTVGLGAIVTDIFEATGYDYFEMYAQKNGAGDGQVGGNAATTFFTGTRLGP